jgi:cyclic beta-1,2-glucan synthetase
VEKDSNPVPAGPEAQAPGVLFTLEQLTQHARMLAGDHRAVTGQGPNTLLPQLDENERELRDYNRATYTVDQARRITPASEWILDNFYLIEEQIHLARRHLPRRYSRELPRLGGGRSAGLPRVYDLVLEFVSRADAQLELGPLTAFLAAYEEVTPLKLGELWAVPIMLRLALIENLRRITDRLTLARRDRDRADHWARRLELMAEQQPSLLVVVVADMARANLPTTSSFVAEFYQRLSRPGAAVPLARSWLEQRLAEQSLSIEQLVREESQNQATDQVSVSHTIASLRLLGAWDWRGFVEGASTVNRILLADPADVYRQMDFATRDRYRHAVEALARHSRLTEAEAAKKAVRLAEAGAAARGREDRTAHIGYYLISAGRSALQAGTGARWPARERLEQAVLRAPVACYLGGILLLTGLSLTAILCEGHSRGLSARLLALFAPVLLVCCSQLAIATVNWISTVVVGPRLLPRLDYNRGIAPESRTMVVVPTLVPDAAAIEHLLETIEIHYLANRDPQLHFALLTDFPDAAAETLPEDAALRALLREGVTGLNRRYGAEKDGLFFLCHRPRRWNPAEDRWIGYERKRGKIVEFNALLRGGGSEAFSDLVGDPAVLPGIKFVITLDTDTQLPPNAARQLVGTMAHPLNRPRFDPARGVVVDGYSILQPRVGVSLPSASRSWFVRLFAGDVGIDPYTRAVSDVYQDLFHEGSFIGKGIYDVDAFEEAVGGKFPENTVLSHDLLESCYARSALVTDVELYEEFPSRYDADVNRRHRWIRGDWQIAPWLLPRVPGGDIRRIINPLSALSRWKIFDNLRRSLVPLALLALLLGSWALVPQLGSHGLALVLAIIAAPTLLALAGDVSRKPEELPLALHMASLAAALGRQAGQVLLTLAFLPYDALVSADAVVRTLLRVLFTHRRLLQWISAGEVARKAGHSLPDFFRTMWFAPALGAAAAAFLAHWEPLQLAFASPLLALWLAAPWIAWRISQPIEPPAAGLSADQHLFLRTMARRTWHFFDTFVTAEEHHLPPDNFQEEPVRRLASRTSPTNLGLALLSNLAGRDFGYLSAGQLLRRTGDTLATMEALERHQGHFFNWYDTRTLRPLPPLYVSTVDSGNLAGHLLTLGPGLEELAGMEILPAEVFAGLGDTCRVLREAWNGDPEAARLEELLAAPPPETLAGRFERLGQAAEMSARIAAAVRATEPDKARTWAQKLAEGCREHRADVLALAPWLASPAAPEEAAGLRRSGRGPTLRELAEPGSRLPGAEAARARLQVIEGLAARSAALARMDFGFLYDADRKLFAIGYNVAQNRRDNSYYDLLASECRLTSYVAIAQGQVSQEHWFALSRLLVSGAGEPVLASWSGSMFEYLMPLLVMPNYENTLLDETCRGAVQRQIDYGRAREVPWGISESGYNLTDAQLNYQYKAFGVPGLGLKRGLAEDLVIAPYATVMALMVAPRAACENLQRLEDDSRCSPYGFYEAVDYTPSRVPPGQTGATVRSYMAHHQGMGLLGFAYFLLDRPMQRRFMACPIFKASELLLQERVPHATAKVLSKELEVEEARKLLARDGESSMRVFTEAAGLAPEVHLLSNGSYHVVVTHTGGGYSRWRDLAVTRWREDSTRDCWGTFLYLRDAATGEFWSAAPQPVLQAVKRAETIFAQGRAEFRHQYLGLEVHTEISVSPEDDVELRRVTLRNPGHSRRQIEVTGYLETVLAPAAAEAAHPAFSNLFVQTEFRAAQSAVLCTRRPRAADEHPPWLFSLLPPPAGDESPASCETDRGLFLGRGHSAAAPAALQRPGPLTNSAGSVLDPAVALRRTVVVPANGEVRVDFVLGMAETRAAAEALVEKYQFPRMADRTFELAWTHSQVALRHLNVAEADAQLYARLGSALVYAQPERRASPAVLLANHRGQDGLWRHAISGDLPIVLLLIREASKMPLVQQLVQAHAYWRLKGLAADLVILDADDSVYRKPLHDEIVALVTAGTEAPLLDKPGGIFVRRLDQIPTEDRVLLQAVARIVLGEDATSLAEQLDRKFTRTSLPAPLRPVRPASREPAPAAPVRDLIFSNGLGGFTRDGREYIITLAAGQQTPAPWINVLANAGFGTIVSESGSSYSWSENCHEFRLTPWHNDPVGDPSGESFYLRDEETGQYWSPTPLPARGATPYTIRHGFGYTVFEHVEHGLASELWIYVATDAPVKFVACKVRNLSHRPRRISVTGYWEWVLGDLRARTLLHVQTELDGGSGAVLARNRYQTDFAERIAFVDVGTPNRSVSGDRLEFIGRNGTMARPAALRRTKLSGRVGPGLDPAGAVQVPLELAPGQEAEVVFRLGAGRSLAEVQGLIQRFRPAGAPRAALEQTWEYWGRTLGAVNLDTPDPAVNVLANGWLLYQTLCCRLWARTGFYQSGGAFGFRDQLQDVMALVHAEPALTRAHLLLAAARQFREGDVQHWWHPPVGRGVRTRFSDDYLWLPYVACRYAACVADTGVWDEPVPFLEGRPLKPEEESYYDLPVRSAESASLYEHCVRAIDHGLNFGTHGLPLMGCGDWNDGMNLVGAKGRGESVWLAFFLCDVLRQFAEVAQSRGDRPVAERYEEQRTRLQASIEREAWDGAWYRRAYFDDGSPLGSSTNPECQIDSLPQSWAVISGAAEPDRASQAMAAVVSRLVRPETGLIQLFDPPFDLSDLDPGYIKGYIPGVRENGGQYTHGAVWTVMACALLGEHDRAWDLFRLLNPVRHGGDAARLAIYKVEPYVLAADVYAVAPHAGRGGWTWYTGSAGWMYRLITETMIGLALSGTALRLRPRLPRAWNTLKVHYRFHHTVYHITLTRWTQAPAGLPALTVDGQPRPDGVIPLQDDHREHGVEVPFL